ncbi:MAG: hypothetical protein XD41_1640 [Desulfonauticus sp. 38_4375]|nr:MAG: hypothetical protein XD41_1640 [Desulfonauticus sp. 38_4375]
MLVLDIPGREKLVLEHLITDYNGTIALDGKVIPGVIDLFKILSKDLKIHIITADTHNNVSSQFKGLDFTIHIIDKKNQDLEKLKYIEKIGREKCVCFGNGANDCLMLEKSALGIAVLQKEGLCSSLLFTSKIVVSNILDGLELLLNPLRLVATLRI